VLIELGRQRTDSSEIIPAGGTDAPTAPVDITSSISVCSFDAIKATSASTP
jgi:hypothetical protein